MSGVFESITPPVVPLSTTLAGLSQGGVGTYMFANNNSGSIVYFGGTVAGSSLRPTTAGHVSQTTSLPTISGTWRCMGYKTGSNTHFGGNYESTLWLRIS